MGFDYCDESIMNYFKKKDIYIKKEFSKIPQTDAIIGFSEKYFCDKAGQSFVLDMIDNPGAIAIFYGYDGVNIYDEIIVALDHSKIIVPNTSAKNFLKKSKTYKNSVLNLNMNLEY